MLAMLAFKFLHSIGDRFYNNFPQLAKSDLGLPVIYELCDDESFRAFDMNCILRMLYCTNCITIEQLKN